MTDVVSVDVRSRMMSNIRSRNTRPELIIRSGLHQKGFRFRIHYKRLPGKPDLVFPKYRAVIFVNGCFWHGHECYLFKWPSTRRKFWRQKILTNRRVDKKANVNLRKLGWRTLTIWECSLKGKKRLPMDTVLARAERWLRSSRKTFSIECKKN